MLPNNLRLAIEESRPLLRGWDGKTERSFRMAGLIAQEQPEVVVEIGVFGGASLIPMAMALKVNGHGIIYGIDPYDMELIIRELAQEDNPASWWVKQDMDVVRNDTLKAIEEFGLSEQVGMIRFESNKCHYLFEKTGIDVLHIDGAHTEKAVMDDVKNYATKVHVGGYIWMDDTHFKSLEKPLKLLETFADCVEDYGCYRLYKVR
jgi:predicted O-methyltransferase YrrM